MSYYTTSCYIYNKYFLEEKNTCANKEDSDVYKIGEGLYLGCNSENVIYLIVKNAEKQVVSKWQVVLLGFADVLIITAVVTPAFVIQASFHANVKWTLWYRWLGNYFNWQRV